MSTASEGKGPTNRHGPLFELTGFRREHPNGDAVEGDVTIRRGRVTAIMGKSGCGKSTILNLLAGIDTFCSKDEETSRLTFHSPEGPRAWGPGVPPPVAELRRHCGIVFQSDQLVDQFSLGFNVALPRLLHGGEPVHAEVEGALSAARMRASDARQNPADLSGGERARGAFFRALAHSPSVVLCDEPTSDLDPELSRTLLGLLIGWQRAEEGRSVVFVTHDPDAAFRWADDLLVWLEVEKGSEGRRQSWEVDPYELDAIDEATLSLTWAKVLRSLRCDWLIRGGPPERSEEKQARAPADGEARPSPGETVPGAGEAEEMLARASAFLALKPPPGGGGPGFGTLCRLAYRDFWPRGQSASPFGPSRLFPALIVLVSLALYSVLFFAFGVQSGIDAHIEAQKSDPVFRMTKLMLPDRTNEKGRAILGRFDLEHAAYVRVDLDVLEDQDPSPKAPGSRAADRRESKPKLTLFGVALDPRGEIFGAVVGSSLTRFHETELERFREEGHSYDGVIIAEAVCSQIFEAKTPRAVRVKWPVAEPNVERGDVDVVYHHMLFPLLGCASWLPGGARILEPLALGRGQSRGHERYLLHDGMLLFDRGSGSMNGKRFEALRAKLAQSLSRFASLERREEVSEIRLVPEMAKKVGERYGVPVRMRTPTGERIRLSRGTIRAAVAEVDASLGVELGYAFRAEDELGKYTDDRWMLPLPQDMDASEYESFLHEAEPEGILADSGVVARLRAMEQLGSTISDFNRFTRDLIVRLLLIFLAVLLLFDALRKLRPYGILSALGLRRTHYLVLSMLQLAVVQAAIALVAVALADQWLLHHVTPYLMTRAASIPIAHVPSSTPPLLLGLFVLGIALAPTLFRLAVLGRRPMPLRFLSYRF